MGALRELSDMARDYGLGKRYFFVVGGILVALMLLLFFWGRNGVTEAPDAVPPSAPAASGAPTSY
jgi:hypothetical protein